MQHMRPEFLAIAFAAALAVACSKPEGVSEPAPKTPEPTAQAIPSVAAPPATPTTGQPPGFAGIWASEAKDCATPTSTFKLSANAINMTPGERACAVKSIDEQHPTGRSALFVVKASCLTEGETSEDTFRLEFGAADTAMQLQLNARDPIRLVRCPGGL